MTIPICANVVKHETYTITDVWTMRFVQHPRNSVENLHRARVWRNSWFRMSSGIHIRKFTQKLNTNGKDLRHKNNKMKKDKWKVLNFYNVSFRVISGNLHLPFPAGKEMHFLSLNHWVFNNFMYSALFKFSTEFLGYWKNRIFHISWWH